MGTARPGAAGRAPFLGVLMLIQIKIGATNSRYPHQFNQTGFIGETCASSPMVLRPIFQMTVGLKDRERRNAPLDCECDGNYRCEQNPSRATITRENRAAIHHKDRSRHYQKQHKRLVSRNPDRQRPGGSAREPPRARHIGGLQSLRTPALRKSRSRPAESTTIDDQACQAPCHERGWG